MLAASCSSILTSASSRASKSKSVALSAAIASAVGRPL